MALALANAGCETRRALKHSIPTSPALGLQDERTERIGKVIQATMSRENIPGLSLAVIDHGKIIWAQGFGWRDVSRKLPVDTNTQFQAGSISKAVTSLGVLALSAAGKVDLDRDVNGYLKGWQLCNPFTNHPVTLRELLCHRAGMVPHGFAGYDEHQQPPSLLEILNRNNFLTGWLTADYFGPIKVVKPPGSAYRYSGGGYCVVQKAVEDVTGEPFEIAMNELVLQPLEMSRSHFQQPPADTNDIACGYSWLKIISGGGRWRVYPEKAMGGLWTTPQDLARIIVAVQTADSGRAAGPISPALAKEYLQPQFDAWQGMGIRVDGEGANRGFYHAGENFGYFARFGAGVSNGRGWVIMVNAQKNKFNSIVQAIGKELDWN